MKFHSEKLQQAYDCCKDTLDVIDLLLIKTSQDIENFEKYLANLNIPEDFSIIDGDTKLTWDCSRNIFGYGIDGRPVCELKSADPSVKLRAFKNLPYFVFALAKKYNENNIRTKE